MRVPSQQAQLQLRQLLLDVADVTTDEFRTFLRSHGYQRISNQINFSGAPNNVYSHAIGILASAGVLNGSFFDQLATHPKLLEWTAEIDSLRVTFDVDPPPLTHFEPERLEGIVIATERADLHSGARYAALATQTPLELRMDTSGPQGADAAWVEALFTAANRQMARPGDPNIWIADLLRLSVTLSEGSPEEHDTFMNALAELQVGHLDDSRVGDRLVTQGGQLERIVMPGGFAVDAGALDDWLGDVRSRTALIRVGGNDKGTGVLVGPDSVLTNWHVLASVIGASSPLGEASYGTIPADTVKFVFDYTTVGGQETKTFEVGLAGSNEVQASAPWLLDWTSAADSELAENPNPPFDQPTDEDQLDFALVRIDTALGEQRGFFPITRSGFGFDLDDPIMVAGHPVEIEAPGTIYSARKRARRLVCSIAGRSSKGANPNATRVRYRTNTDPGSSGSPVFNDQFEFVALHHFGQEGAYNQGIPIAAIHRRLERQNKLNLLD